MWIPRVAFALLALCACTAQPSSDPQVQALLKAQQSSRDGVIKLNTDTFAKYITGKQRSFSLFVFLTATNLRDNPQLGLVEMRKDFGYVGKALKEKVAKGEIAAGSIFLVESDFLDSQELFRRLQAQSLPFTFILPPTASTEKDRIKLRAEDQMRPDSYDRFPWTSEEFGNFLTEKTAISLGRIVRPSLFTSPLFPFLALGSLISFGLIGFKLYYAEFMKNLLIWTFGSLVVYWFSVSGGMHNIIRGMPLYALTQQGAQFFMPPGQGQLGAEGFICGTGYLTVGLAVTAMTYLPKYIAGFEEKKRRWIAYAVIGLGSWSFLQVVALYRWKTGNHYRTFF